MVFQRRPTRSARPIVLGLAGGVGSGKSAVATRLAALGAVVADADRICHRALDRAEIAAKIIAHFGDVRGEDGQIDRRKLRAVFDDAEARCVLESILHPIVRQETDRILGEAAVLGRPMVVIDAPLLFEVGLDRMCDAVLFVDSPPADREARAQSRGWSEAEWRRRETNQWPLERKRKRSEHVLVNAGDLPALEAAVDGLWPRLLAPEA